MKAINPVLFFSVLIATLLTACVGKSFPPESPEYVVQTLFKVSAKDGIPKDQAKLSLYFDGRMAELLAKDFSCVNNGETCSLLYFDPVSQSKDPDIGDLEIVKPEGGTEVYVSFTQREFKYNAIYVMTLTSTGWRIGDIIYYGANSILDPGASVLTALSLQQELPAPWHPPVPGLPEDLSE
jgi:hypothetical protein